MTIKEKIIQTLHKASPGLQELKDDFFIIGSAASILSDVDIENTQDIDMVMSKRDAQLLKEVWKKNDLNILPEKSGKFRSEFSRYDFDLLDIEVSGGMEICIAGEWKPFIVYDYEVLPIAGLLIKIPTLTEQKNILRLFGREKDLQKIKLINERLKK